MDKSFLINSLMNNLFNNDNNLFITSDTHFNHEKIIQYCNRQYKTVKDMDEDLINKWNNVVKEEDIVLHLGDFGFGNKQVLGPIRERLNGKIHLILGNHDRRNTMRFWNTIGIDNIYKTPLLVNDLIFSHEPVECSDDMINVHGHIHNTTLNTKFNSKNHINISTDITDFSPVNIRTILIGKE